MWRTGSSFDGEDFRLSDPSLYRVLDEAEVSLTELDIADSPSFERRRRRAPRRPHPERWGDEWY